MKYFVVEGILKAADKINDTIMTEHMAYTQKSIDSGLILMSGLKSDMSGGIFIIKSDSVERINDYLNNEPFNLYGIQDYKITEFDTHYCNESPSEWFKK
ncbi:YciI family protein [Clostridium sp. D53t1_180928_C8]|uniref:YciI family protein n=1 Tax=Clostridium sp. D53t1_180928_C8 TaxID=2787101 RepID=UPI0018AAAA38|nr:YciI family protein [Clostridium sp. D53t1_180928_C8]